MLSAYTGLLDETLLELLTLPDVPEKILESVRYSIGAGGKRLRPGLFLAAHGLIKTPKDTACFFAGAIEMIHTYSLIHDDLPCMDDDDTRRGKPSNHVAFGEWQALLAGDALLNHAALVMTRAILRMDKEDRIQGLKAQEIILTASGMEGMIAGQWMDMESENARIDLKTLERIYLKKTADLIAASCESGGVLAGGTDEQTEALKVYGIALGRAFQIADDILDIVADEEQLGKPVGSDANRGKATYPSLCGMNEAKQAVYRYTEDAVHALKVFKNGGELEEWAVAMRDRLF